MCDTREDWCRKISLRSSACVILGKPSVGKLVLDLVCVDGVRGVILGKPGAGKLVLDLVCVFFYFEILLFCIPARDPDKTRAGLLFYFCYITLFLHFYKT